MIELIHHIVRISSRRDRTEINAAMLDAMEDLFHPERVTIYRCYGNGHKMVVFACAGRNDEGRYVLNAYLPDQGNCRRIDTDPLLNRCRKELSIVLSPVDEAHQRLVFPIIFLDEPAYLIDVTLPTEFAADNRVALMGLTEYFANHIALLNYGEADTLTGLASRKTFDKHLFELLGQAASDQNRVNHSETPRRRGKEPNHRNHWLAVCDIDRFKSINDNFGHLIGDEVLIMLSRVMRQSFRFDDQLFRFGGEEFIVMLQPASLESAQRTLNRFRENVEKTTFSRVGHVTISIGFSQLMPNDTPTDVIDRADEALYFAKQHGRNRVDHYESLIASGGLAPKNVEKGEVELF